MQGPRKTSEPDEMHTEDRRIRSLTKACSWRVMATLTTVFLVFAFTGEVTTSLGIGALEVVAKLVLFYGHERTWQRIKWGYFSS